MGQIGGVSMISKLTLKNFRCFQDFTLEGIRPVTLIAGVNNVGKSTLLESIYLFENRYIENVYLTINSLRGLQQENLSPPMVWEPLFSNMDTSKEIEISVMDAENSKTQTFSICRDDSFSITSLPKQFSFFRPTLDSYPLKLTYKNQNEIDIAHLVLTDTQIVIIPEESINVKVPSIRYLNSKIAIPQVRVAEMLSRLSLDGEQEIVIKAMKLLDPRVKDLSVAIIAERPVVYADLGLSKRLPINVLGDGINKLMHLLFTMLTSRNSIVLIDEIENGFHYTFFPKLWEVIGELSVLTNCQVFATTHSYECICGALDISKRSELFRFVRLDKQDEVIVAKAFDNDSFFYAIDHEWEVR
jgi:AAA15 family ATPase/GTPase